MIVRPLYEQVREMNDLGRLNALIRHSATADTLAELELAAAEAGVVVS